MKPRFIDQKEKGVASEGVASLFLQQRRQKLDEGLDQLEPAHNTTDTLPPTRQ